VTNESPTNGGTRPPSSSFPDDDLPVLDEYELLRRGDDWVALSSSEAVAVRLLLGRFGRVVGRDRLEAAVWPRGSPSRALLNQLMIRVRRRVGPLELEIATVRGRGYLLRNADDPMDGSTPGWPISSTMDDLIV
jgi:DNA-binding winged helix-turn-helix (wHTH) protein